MSSNQPDQTDHGTAANSAGKQNASAKPSQREDTQGKLFAPNSPVDVPNMPAAKTDAAKEMETLQETAVPKTEREVTETHAKGDSRPVKVDTTESNWADSTQPAPDKRNARSSII